LDHNLTLCLLCDLSVDEQSLGPKSLLRLRAAHQYAGTANSWIVVAAGMSPSHPRQPIAMAKMAHRQLAEWGFTNVIVLEASTFNTRGELAAFLSLTTSGRRSVVSAEYHLMRTKVIIRQVYGRRLLSSLHFVVAQHDRLVTVREKVQEGLKWVHLFLPPRLRTLTVEGYRKLVGNPSY
jgi:DUF218 domain